MARSSAKVASGRIDVMPPWFVVDGRAVGGVWQGWWSAGRTWFSTVTPRLIVRKGDEPAERAEHG